MATKTKLDPRAEELYERCLLEASTGDTDMFNQADLEKYKIAKDSTELLVLCQSLIMHNFFQILTFENAPCYRCRSREDAAKMSQMGDKEHMIYTYIEGSGTTGIWTKQLSAKANLHQTVLAKAIKFLEGKGWIKQIKSVKFPKRKIYMLKDLEPTEEVTGGPWFTDGELDADLIESVLNLVENHVKEVSWHTGHRVKPTPAQAERKDPHFYGPATYDKKILLPYPPGYSGYPTARDILDWLDSTGIVQDKDISVTDMKHLCDVLIYDGRLEKIGKKKIVLSLADKLKAGKSRGVDGDGDGDEVESVESDDIVNPRKKQKTARGKEKATGSPAPGSATASPRPGKQTKEPAQEDKESYEDMYRWIRRPDEEDLEKGPGNGFSEAPCAHCPVFRLCEEGGPVTARNCEYFGPWIKGETGATTEVKKEPLTA